MSPDGRIGQTWFMDEWTAFHFSQANPVGEGQNDVPALLHRVADTLSEMGELDVLDITFETEVTADGKWPSMTVYYIREN